MEISSGTNPLAWSSSLVAEVSELTMSPGSSRSITLLLENTSRESDRFALSVDGVAPEWAAFESDEPALLAGEEKEIELDINIPEDCGISESEYTISVSAASPDTGMVANGGTSILLHVENAPVMADLVPEDGISIGTNSASFSWRTDAQADSMLYYRVVGETEFSAAAGTSGTIHNIVLDNLVWDTTYEWYVSSQGTCGIRTSEVRSLTIKNGVAFQDIEPVYDIIRDYDQRVSLLVVNGDNAAHPVRAEVVNGDGELIAGFIGSGSIDEPLELAAGETEALILALHAQDTQSDEYDLVLKLVADADSANPMVEYKSVKIRVKDPIFDLELVELEQNPHTMTNTYKVTNHGDTITDLNVFFDDAVSAYIVFQPRIEHMRLAGGESIEFTATFQPREYNSTYFGTLTAEGDGRTMIVSTHFGCESGTSLYETTLEDLHLCLEQQSWYCTNRPDIDVNFDIPGGIDPEMISRARLYINFTPRTAITKLKEHNVTVKFNDIVVASYINTIPTGSYGIEVPANLIRTGRLGAGRNKVSIESVHMNGGHYATASDFQLILDVDTFTLESICASSQAEADAQALTIPWICDGEPAWEPQPVVTNVTVLDENGLEQTRFEPGQTAQIRVPVYNPALDLRTCTMTVLIDDDFEDGVGVYEQDYTINLNAGETDLATFWWNLPEELESGYYHVKAVMSCPAEEPKAFIFYNRMAVYKPSTHFSIMPAAYEFGCVNIGDAKEKVFTLTNTGDTEIQPEALQITGASDFTVSANECSGNLMVPAATCTFRIAFSPESEGFKNAIISISLSDPSVLASELSLSGTGSAALPDNDNDGIPDEIDSDDDNDGMPDDWENQYGLNPMSDDADQDPDNDGSTNLDEYLNNTNPGVAGSVYVSFIEPDVVVSLQGNNRVFFEVENLYAVPKTVQLSVEGLDSSWYTLSDEDRNILLMPFGRRKIMAQLHLPLDCGIAGDHPFSVTAAWQHDDDAAAATAGSTLTITPDPNVYRLAIPENTKLAGNRILLAWKTDVPTDGVVFYRKLGDTEYIEVDAGSNTVEHRVAISDLEYFTAYEYYTQSRSACNGLAETIPAIVKTGKAVKFVDDVNEFWVDRDDKQTVQLTIQNTDEIAHTFDLSVINDHDDIMVGFVGSGSTNRQATLEAGESIQVELSVHAADALQTQYDIYLKTVSDQGLVDSFVDISHAIVHIRPFVTNLDLQQVESTPGLMTYRYRLINYGDPLGDIEVFVDNESMPKTWMVPEIHHIRLGNEEYIEFDIHAQEHLTGTVYARSGNYQISAPFEIGCPDSTNLKTYTLTDVPVEAQIKDWYCTNKTHVELPFVLPKGLNRSGVVSASVQLNFNLPMELEKYDPHDVIISINDKIVATLTDVIPEGSYEYRIPTSYLQFGQESGAKNYLTLDVEGVGAGQYIVATDFRVKIHAGEMAMDLCVPPPLPGPPPELPDPETKIVSITPSNKYRPGDTVHVEVELYNNDDPGNAHQGTLTLIINNDSNPEGDHPVDKDIQVFDLNVLPGSKTVPYDYHIPDDADDINYTVTATFENLTLDKISTGTARNGGFYVRTPLIVVHGIMASELQNQSGEQLWGASALATPCDNTLDALMLDGDGIPVQDGISAVRVLDKMMSLSIFGNDFFVLGDSFYSLEKHLDSEKYKIYLPGSGDRNMPAFKLNQVSLDTEEKEDVFYFVYDWRMDNADIAVDLNTFIGNVIAAQGYSKVNLVAHSMGGLVCKSMLQQDETAQDRVGKMIFIGTPNLGAVESFTMMRHGLRDPRFGQTIHVDASELLSQADAAHNLIKGAVENITDPSALSALSWVLTVIEIEGKLIDPEHCSDGIKIAKAILGAISFFQGDVRDALSVLYDYYNLDKDLDWIRDSQAKKLSESLISSFQLLPSEQYFPYEPDGYYQVDEQKFDQYDQMKAKLAEWYSDTLLSRGETLHNGIDDLILPADSYLVAGCSQCTTYRLIEATEPLRLRFIEGDGDGTVPLNSALDIHVEKKYAVIGGKHIGLPSQRGVRYLVESLLKGYEENYRRDGDCSVVNYQEGVCPPPVCTVGKISFNIPKLPLPDWPGIKITGGGETDWISPNGIRLGILGSDYRYTNEGVEVYVPQGQVYTLEFSGVDPEYLEMKFQLMSEGGALKTYIFKNLTLDMGGCGQVTFDLTQAMIDPVLRIDQNCDGIYEQEDIPPTDILDENESEDYTAPETVAAVSGILGTDGWYTSDVNVTLTATDSGGSGLWKTRYRFSSADEYTEYEYGVSNTGPISLTFSEPGEYKLYFHSVDRNLNREYENIIEFKIENLPPRIISFADQGYFALNTVSVNWQIEPGTAPVQLIQYSVGTLPGSADMRDWTDTGTTDFSGQVDIDGLPESCSDLLYINLRAANQAGLESTQASTDGIIVLAQGQDDDQDGFANEAEVAAGSNPCNEDSIPKDSVISLKKGFNLVSIPAEIMFRPDLNDWLPMLGTTEEIEKILMFDKQTKTYLLFSPDPSGNPSAPLTGGEVLIVYAKQDKSISFTSALCVEHDLTQGINMVGFACAPPDYSAYQVLAVLGSDNVHTIQRINTLSGIFETAGFDEYGQIAGMDFKIVPGEGYFIYMKQAVTGFLPE